MTRKSLAEFRPDSECADEGAASCGQNGSCNGAGACAEYPDATPCAQGCSDNTGPGHAFASTCVSGTCKQTTISSCAGYVCAGSACLVAPCSDDNSCSSAYWCNGSLCLGQWTAGHSCLRARQCVTGVCSSGFCT